MPFATRRNNALWASLMGECFATFFASVVTGVLLVDCSAMVASTSM
jgi:hypothetical protein